MFLDHSSEDELMEYIFYLVIRASVPKLDLDSVFEQKNDIAKAVEEELEKVLLCPLCCFRSNQSCSD